MIKSYSKGFYYDCQLSSLPSFSFYTCTSWLYFNSTEGKNCGLSDKKWIVSHKEEPNDDTFSFPFLPSKKKKKNNHLNEKVQDFFQV